jgi:hypothetical protein
MVGTLHLNGCQKTNANNNFISADSRNFADDVLSNIASSIEEEFLVFS